MYSINYETNNSESCKDKSSLKYISQDFHDENSIKNAKQNTNIKKLTFSEKSMNGLNINLPSEFNYRNFSKSRINICAICCKDYHMNFRCHLIETIKPQLLLKIVHEKNLCKICFRGGHSPKMCSFINLLRCKICNKLHNTKLHLDIFNEIPKIQALSKSKNFTNEIEIEEKKTPSSSTEEDKNIIETDMEDNDCGSNLDEYEINSYENESFDEDDLELIS